MTVGLLDKGTTKNSKLEIAEKLENLGAFIGFQSGSIPTKISFSGQCLIEDLPVVMDLLAEQLRSPAFDEGEFEIIKTQIKGNLKFSMDDPGANATIRLAQLIYPKDHPNYKLSFSDAMELIDNVSIQDIRNFHKKHYGPENMQLVVVGDTDDQKISESVKKSFGDWKGGVKQPTIMVHAHKPKGMTEILTFEQKPSATLLLATPTGLNKTHPDYLPLFISALLLLAVAFPEG